MTRFAEVTEQHWFAAPVATVRAQFADIEHHIRAGVHPKLHFEMLAPVGGRVRYAQEVRLLGVLQRDVIERSIGIDGTMTDVSVEGFNRGGTLVYRFAPERREGRDGSSVTLTITLPMPRGLGWLRPLLQAQVRREVRSAIAEDRHDIEVRGYPAAGAGLRAA